MGYCFTRDSLLLLLADGMGGHIMGEMAATIVIQTIGGLFQQQAKPYINRPLRFLEDSFIAAHREIHRYAAMNNLPDTPRTTLVTCLIQRGAAFWAHCGDSRLYWIRNGQLLLRTKDHSKFEKLAEQGLVDESQRASHPDRNRLFNCVGASSDPILDISHQVSLQAGDIVLLCSDGLWSVLPEQMILQQLRDRTIVRAIPELLNKAVSIAGKEGDNATALAVMWEGEDDNPSTVTTHTLPSGAVTTTIQARLNEIERSDVQEDGERAFEEMDIEKAIEEIRSAIQNK
jgi:protein phosphatase